MLNLSVVVPVHNAPDDLARCVAALRASDLPRDEWEVIVVDDGSREDLRPPEGSSDNIVTVPAPARGPAFARNRGAEAARAAIVAFIDADVTVRANALTLIVQGLRDRSIDAIFGSYDDRPAHRGVVSQYRNLLHHYVHQHNAGKVESFWAGCGAIRAETFRSVGMFDERRYVRPEMEDVELGYRLRDSGHSIVLDPRILCTHRKRWTLRSMIASDFARRGVPWTRLLLERRELPTPKGLSVGSRERASILLAASTVALAVAAVFCRSWTLAAAALLAGAMFIGANWNLLAWLRRIRGLPFAIAAVPLHFVYNAVAIAAVAVAVLAHAGQGARSMPQPREARRR